MATDVQEILRSPGRIILTPTDFVTAPNYGGTELGKLVAAAVDWGIESVDVPGLENGEPVDQIELIGALTLSLVFRGWDDDLVAILHPNVVNSTSGGKRIQGRGTRKHGRLRSSRSVALLFVPDNLAHRAIYVPRALPEPEVGQALTLMGAARYGFPAVFTAMDDGSGRTYFVDLIADLATDVAI